MTGQPDPYVDYTEDTDGYPGERCEVCGAPATLRVRWWQTPRVGIARAPGAVEAHYFCASHREAAERRGAALRSRRA
jgi:hypothetical protein